MTNDPPASPSPLLLQIGGAAAIVGTILQVGTGTISSSLPVGDGDEALRAMAGQVGWLPVIYFGFVLGALLWVWPLVALVAPLTDGPARALGMLAPASLVRAWAAAPEAARSPLVNDFALLRHLFAGTWAGVITLFHGVPFVLAGLAVVVSRRYPGWLGWIGCFGGAGSAVIGLALFFGAAPAGLAVSFAVVLGLFMVILGWLFILERATAATDR